MDFYVVVHAEFPRVTNDKREKIYELLKEKGWTKLETNGICISTTWVAIYNESKDIDLNSIKQDAQSEFESITAELRCVRPSLIVHVGFDEPLVSPI